MRYVAFVHKDPDSAYGISFPDFPGCVSVGDTMDEVIANGTEALGFHVRGMEADGDIIPQPRSLEEITHDVEGLLKAIDDEARSRGQTRSAFIASAARRELID